MTLLTNGMYGWTFLVSESLTVAGLGWFDLDLDGWFLTSNLAQTNPAGSDSSYYRLHRP